MASRPPRRLYRIEIAGGIASGKTTLARLLNAVGLHAVHERFRENPFYEAFYEDPNATAFETEITFILQHYHLQRKAMLLRRPYCTDFSIILDQSYARVTLTRSDLRLFSAIQRRVEKALRPRSLLILLHCPPDIELKRIRRRRRAAEAGISLAYLQKLHKSLRACVANLPLHERILRMDSGTINFAHDANDQQLAVRMVTNAVREIGGRL
jgi:deoxyadenosine/deoxycytidine kinase